jgi:hypothetical protein
MGIFLCIISVKADRSLVSMELRHHTRHDSTGQQWLYLTWFVYVSGDTRDVMMDDGGGTLIIMTKFASSSPRFALLSNRSRAASV